MPVVGNLEGGSPEPSRVVAFHKGLRETGYVEARNVAIEYRWAHNNTHRHFRRQRSWIALSTNGSLAHRLPKAVLTHGDEMKRREFIAFLGAASDPGSTRGHHPRSNQSQARSHKDTGDRLRGYRPGGRHSRAADARFPLRSARI